MNEITFKKAARIWLVEALIVILALVALRKGNSYDYYIFLRWAVCPAFVWIAWKAYSRGLGLLLVVSAGVLALLFNPIIRVGLARDKWEILNIALVVVAIWSAVAILDSLKKQT